jgi:cell division protein FtsI/penicillin-binding protein 2
MVLLTAIAFVCLGYRLVELQVLEHERFRGESEIDTHRTILRAPKRGDIRDIRGNLLAGSVFVKTILADPLWIGDHRFEVAHALAPLLELSESELLERLELHFCTNAQGRVVPHQVVLKHKVPTEVWEQVQEALLRLPTDHAISGKKERASYNNLRESGIFAAPVDDQQRVYPNQTLAAHVLGYVGSGSIVGPKGKIDQIAGKYGIEKTLDKALSGSVGWRNTDFAKRQELVTCRDEDIQARPGYNVVLTIDAAVQHIVEFELAQAMEKHTPISASGLVVRPRTGEILALANLPTFNPNDLEGSTDEDRRNRVVADQAEPGSTFKIVVISGALNDSTVTLDDRFDCENGLFWFAGRPLKDHEPYGILSVEQIITHSSNIGAAKVGLKMGPERLYQYMRAFGFGTRTGIPLPGEVPGSVHKVDQWSKLSISRIPMGHEVAVTSLQMVMAMCAVANEGRLMRPLIVDRLEDDNGNVMFRNYPQQVRQVVSEPAARLMVTALKTVVTTNGTGKKAMLEHYTVAGKTGTAQKWVNGSYSTVHHFSSFIGFFPADNPEVCVAVFLDDPKHGYYAGEAAAPVFHEIAERVARYLAIKADTVPQAPPPAAVPGPGTTVAAVTLKRF